MVTATDLTFIFGCEADVVPVDGPRFNNQGIEEPAEWVIDGLPAHEPRLRDHVAGRVEDPSAATMSRDHGPA